MPQRNHRIHSSRSPQKQPENRGQDNDHHQEQRRRNEQFNHPGQSTEEPHSNQPGMPGRRNANRLFRRGVSQTCCSQPVLTKVALDYRGQHIGSLANLSCCIRRESKQESFGP